MKIGLTEQFRDDESDLPASLQHKCRELLSSLSKIEVRSLQEKALPGWRLHKLKTSPFTSLSLDMNYRVLCKIEGDIAVMYRVVKHDLADTAYINRNDSAPAAYFLESAQLKPADVFDALVSLGIPLEGAKPFHGIQSDDQLIEALEKADPKIAEMALTLYETTGVVIPRTRFTLLQNDKKLEAILSGEQAKWEVYLHPSQRYVVSLPVTARIFVSGSAGTGKTVCAWHRIQHLAMQKHTVGFVCSSKYILDVSKERIAKLVKDSPVDVYYLLPSTVDDLLQLAAAVEHIVIDEGQEFATTWYVSLGAFLASHQMGLTLFYDLNQLGGNIDSGDKKRYEYRLTTWDDALRTIPGGTSVEFYINYRNSREIADYYSRILEEALPKPIRSEIPVFGSGEVIVHKSRDAKQLPVVIADIIKKLSKDFRYSEIGVICIGSSSSYTVIANALTQLGIPCSVELDAKNAVTVSIPRIMRGHERKAIIVCTPYDGTASGKWGKAINFYIGLSRARDKLIVVQTGD